MYRARASKRVRLPSCLIDKLSVPAYETLETVEVDSIRYTSSPAKSYRISGSAGRSTARSAVTKTRPSLIVCSVSAAKSFSSTVSPDARATAGCLLSVRSCPPSLTQKETNINVALADDDRVRIGKRASVDVDRKVAGAKAGQRTMNGARELVTGSARPDRFPNGKSKQVANAHRRGKREGTRAGLGDGMEIERYLHSDHGKAISAASRSCLLPRINESADVLRERAGRYAGRYSREASRED